jgi:hypothetical protein
MIRNRTHNLVVCSIVPQTTMLLRRMVSTGTLRHLALERTDVSEELSASFIRVTRIGELGTLLAVTSYELSSSETSVPTRATWCNIPEESILHSNCHENLKS